MTVRISKIYIRPNLTTLWHYEVLDSDEYFEQFITVHLVNCISNEKREIDSLRMEFIVEWTSEEACQAYWNDPILKKYWLLRDVYNEAVGIIPQDTVIEHIPWP
jgi:hypothetical protein